MNLSSIYSYFTNFNYPTNKEPTNSPAINIAFAIFATFPVIIISERLIRRLITSYMENFTKEDERLRAIREKYFTPEHYDHFPNELSLLPLLLNELPISDQGKSYVFIGKTHVIKACGEQGGSCRLRKKQLFKIVCERNGYKHLVVPNATLKGQYLFEKRMPVLNFQQSINLYKNNAPAFNEAVQEITNLLFRSNFLYLITYSETCIDLQYNFRVTPRYDNICPILEGKQGKLVFVDLERFEQSLYDDHLSDTEKLSDNTFGTQIKHREAGNEYRHGILCVLVSLFPHHLELIISEAEKASQPYNRERLENIQSCQLMFRSYYTR